MPTLFDSPLDLIMKGTFVPFPDPGAPFNQTISRGETYFVPNRSSMAVSYTHLRAHET